MNYLTIQNERSSVVIVEPAMIFPYELDTFQHNSAVAIEQGNTNILVCAHTSAGKSTVAEYAIAKAIKNNKRVIYTSPIKTLSNQKYRDFKNKFGDNVGIMTGDIKLNPDAQCVIMTTEILRNSLYNRTEFLQDVEAVIFDEIHYFNDPDRGHIWEESIIMLPNEINLIMLSASISKPDEFAIWIGNIKQKAILLVSTSYRPVPLVHYAYDGERMVELMGKKKVFNFENYDNVIKEFEYRKKTKKNFRSLFDPFANMLVEKDLLPAIFFTFSRNKCLEYARLIHKVLIEHTEQAEIEKIFNLNIHRLFEDPEKINQIYIVKNLLMKGICMHHSGLIPVLKEIIEELFSKGLIKILFATETFAVGVNMPTRTVVFTGLSKYSSIENDFRYLRSDEYTQMSGRSGRRGKDKIGTVIYMPLNNIVEKYSIGNIYLGKQPKMISKFMLSTKFILKAIRSQIQSINGVLDNSLINLENNNTQKNINNDCKELRLSLQQSYKLIIDYSENDIEQVKEYIEINYKIKKSKNKEKKKLEKKLQIIKDNKSKDFDNLYNIYIQKNSNEIKLKDIEYDLQNIPNIFNIDIENKIRFLCDLNFINNGILNNKDLINNISSKDLTFTGILATEINECDELLLVNLIENEIFDNLGPIEIMTLLSIFIEDKVCENTSEFKNKYLDKEFYNILNNTFEIDNNIDNICNKYNINYNSGINKDYINITNYWLHNHNIGEITKLFEIFEGNFIKNMQKIQNISLEIINICEISSNFLLIEKIQKIQPILVRDIVMFKSMYI